MKGDIQYYAPGRKRPVAASTKATSDFLVVVTENYPGATISQLRKIISDRTQYILNPEAVAVLDAHIKAGFGDRVPNWK